MSTDPFDERLCGSHPEGCEGFQKGVIHGPRLGRAETVWTVQPDTSPGLEAPLLASEPVGRSDHSPCLCAFFLCLKEISL